MSRGFTRTNTLLDMVSDIWAAESTITQTGKSILCSADRGMLAVSVRQNCSHGTQDELQALHSAEEQHDI